MDKSSKNVKKVQDLKGFVFSDALSLRCYSTFILKYTLFTHYSLF